MSNPDFGQTVTEVPTDDGTIKIRTEGYMNGRLNSYKVQIREDIKTGYQTLLSDYIACLDIFKKTTTPELIIVIRRDHNGTPYIIQKTWQIEKGIAKPNQP